MAIAGMIVFWMIVLVGIAVIPFGIAGTFIIVGDVLVYGLITKFQSFSPSFVGLLLIIAVAVELIEAVLGAYMAKRFGGSRWAMVGAVLGGIGGAIIGTILVPVAGTLLGAFIGAFLGAMILEMLQTSDMSKALRAGMGAMFGTMGGKVTKIVAAIVMTVMIAMQIF